MLVEGQPPLAARGRLLVAQCRPLSARLRTLVGPCPPPSASARTLDQAHAVFVMSRHPFLGSSSSSMKQPKLQFEHPTQAAASAFLRAVLGGDAVAMWSALSRETRGLLEGLYAARAGVSLRAASGIELDGTDERLGSILAPLRASVLAALGEERIGGYGVSNARLVDRQTAYVLLLPDFGEERVVEEQSWKPSHLLAFLHEHREWLLDLAKTAELSGDAELPDPLGGIRR